MKINSKWKFFSLSFSQTLKTHNFRIITFADSLKKIITAMDVKAKLKFLQLTEKILAFFRGNL